MRRRTPGGAPSLALIEFGLDIPGGRVHGHHLLASLRGKTLNLNADIPYVPRGCLRTSTLEKSQGLAIHNAVEVVMNEQEMSLQVIMDWLDGYCADAIDGFRPDATALPSWGQLAQTHPYPSFISAYLFVGPATFTRS
ncbi:hypothetical protein P691DRAFT_835832 [Macrolepiota fuliginosa MF-IS2]|uniref:Uncharacterized protein n=1 Tax=Macrolepiota fuliginosa MF-IS2 TaxID=1400762 RepID=A0A9P6C0T8_9AGAR|nr:hypothetical protein P691DRAFT_835832 [Macrolepiota fuliginosa MF-IS2]